MITTNYVTLTPAYGRDYRNKKDVTQHFLDGKDFVLSNSYVSIRDFAAGTKVNIRYANKTKVTVVTVPSTV